MTILFQSAKLISYIKTRKKTIKVVTHESWHFSLFKLTFVGVAGSDN